MVNLISSDPMLGKISNLCEVVYMGHDTIIITEA